MLISLLIIILIAGLAYWVAGLILPHPIPAIIAVLILIVWFAGDRVH